VARSHVPLLVFGEAGSGRESLAVHIHALHPTPTRDLVRIDCAADGEGRASSFCTIQGCAGMMAEASGTLILREIADLPPSRQAAVARMIDPSGGSRPWRLIATSSRDLAEEARYGRLRPDLYAALSKIILYLPPLRQRRCDIPDLVRHFLEQTSEDLGVTSCRISEEAMVALWNYDWPGNVTELESVVRRLASMRGRSLIHAPDLPPYIHGRAASGDARPASPSPTMRFRAAV
jgi:DNA-binding NtrC family response regulator